MKRGGKYNYLRKAGICNILFFILTAFLLMPHSSIKGQEGRTGKIFIVAPGGSDSNPGTPAQPLATLEAARDAARKAGPVNHRIIVKPGEYFISTPLELDSRDNGLTIEADTGGPVTLYGGIKVTGWKKDGDKFWYAELPGVREGTWDFRALVINDKMPERARLPEEGTFTHTQNWDVKVLPAVAGYWERQPLPEEKLVMSYDPKDISESLDTNNAEVRVYHMWDESFVGVSRNDIQNHRLFFSSPAIYPPGAFGVKKYVIYNTIEGMTKPGRWYLDRTAGRLVYWPLEGEDMAKIKVVAPKVERILHIAGGQDKKVENITIKGLRFEVTTIPLKSAGFGGSAFDGAINMTNANNCSIENVEVANVGGAGISATQLDGCSIINSHVHNTGACLVKFNGTDVVFSGNHIHNAGVYYPSSCALYSGGSKNKISGNEIHDAPYSGMIIGRSDLLVEDNLIYRVMREIHDGAAIYASGSYNVVMRGNVVRDISEAGQGFGVSAYYFDEGAHDNILENNVAINVSRPIHNHIARNTLIRDNVFITDEDMTLSFQSSAKFRFEGNTLITPGRLRMVSPHAITIWKDNKIFSGGAGKDNISQGFKIDSAMPAYTKPGPKTKPVEVIRTGMAPTIDGELSNNEWEGDFQRLDREISRMPYSGAPVIVKFSYDNRYLYVGALITMFDVNNISKGSRWKKDDGIEIAIKGMDKGKPMTYVIRTYVDGTVQSVTDAGASEQAAKRVSQGVKYMAKVLDRPRRGWIAEWAIPLDALGIKLKTDLKVPFNMSAYINEYDNWHCWEGTQGETWEVDKAGTLHFN